MATRVYSYGCEMVKDPETLRLIGDQLELANLYRVALAKLDRAARFAYAELRKQHYPRIDELEIEASRLREVVRLMHEGGHKTLAVATKTELAKISAEVKALREAVKHDKTFAEHVTQLNERKKALGRNLRRAFGERGLFYSTYALAERAAQAANAGKLPPDVPYWRLRPENLRRSGVLAIQESMPTERAYEPNRYCWIERPVDTSTRKLASQSVAHYRVASVGGKPLLVRLNVVHSRPLPKGEIVWIMLSISNLCRVKATYELQFVVKEADAAHSPRPEQGVNSDGSLRSARIDEILSPWTTGLKPPRPRTTASGVATVMFADNMVTAEIDGVPIDTSRLNERITSPVNDLKSVRAHHLNNALGVLEKMRDRRDSMPFFASRLLDKLQHAKSPRQLIYALPRLEPLMTPVEVSLLLNWVNQEEHLYDWERCAAEKQRNQRTWLFRNFAAELAARASRVLIDGRELNDPRRGSAENRDRALGDLRSAIVNRFADGAQVVKGDSHEELREGVKKEKRATGRARTAKAIMNEARAKKKLEMQART